MRSHRYGLTAIILSLTLISLAIGGCRGDEERSRVDATLPTVQVTDDLGHELGFATPPERIISLIPSTTELIVTLGATDRLVARTDFDEDPALAELPSVGPGLTPSLEWLTAHRPELVISWADARDRGLTTRLGELGITVYSARIETLDDVISTTRRIGDLLGLSTTADSLIGGIEAGLEGIRKAVAGRDRPVVFYVVGDEPPLTAGGGTFLDELISIAGGKNLFHDLRGWPQVSLEEALHREPDLLIIPTGEGNAPLERLARRPGWRELRAVRMGHLHSIDAIIAHRPGPRVAEVAEALAEIMHPEAFMPNHHGSAR